jgi:outer membrane lipoprotein-sorting protein
VDTLKDIKAQLTAINSLEAHFKQFITTGKLAKIELEK